MTEMLLFFDTETTGFTKKDFTDPGNPFCLELACILTDCDDSGDVMYNAIIDNRDINDGSPVNIPKVVSDIHGIDSDMVDTYGLRSKEVLKQFFLMLSKADLLVAHNADFDVRVMMAYAYRHGWADSLKKMLSKKELVCTQKLATPICKLPPTDKQKKHGFKVKAPKLVEAYDMLVRKGDERKEVFFGREGGNHRALVDAYWCKEVFFEIHRRTLNG